MKNYCTEHNGYTETIQKGIDALRRFDMRMSHGSGSEEEQTARLRTELAESDAVIVGAGAGLSTSAGMTYSGDRFERYFFDFAEEFGIRDMYSGGFYPFPDEETLWAWWARHIYYNRYIDAPVPVYPELLSVLKEKDYFVITTNVDHQFQRAGFDKKRLFYTQGDYGLFQVADGSVQETYDNEEWTVRAMEAQGFTRDTDGIFRVPENRKIKMRIPSELIPRSPDGRKIAMNLRSDFSFVEDAGWHRASAAYYDFILSHDRLRILYLELGVGENTPMIIKYPFWQMTADNEKAVYACVNFGSAYCPKQIEKQSVCINGDIRDVLRAVAGT